MKKPVKTPKPEKQTDTEKKDFAGYPHYPKSQDIYSQSKEEQEIDPEDLTRLKTPVDPEEIEREEETELEELEEGIMGEDLDIPGSELDDEAEEIGNEDEENNYYSIGGDKHTDLEEDQGEEEFP